MSVMGENLGCAALCWWSQSLSLGVLWEVRDIACLNTQSHDKTQMRRQTEHLFHPIHHHNMPPQRPQPSFPSPNALTQTGSRCLPGSLHSGIHFALCAKEPRNETPPGPPPSHRRRTPAQPINRAPTHSIPEQFHWQAAVHWERGVFSSLVRETARGVTEEGEGHAIHSRTDSQASIDKLRGKGSGSYAGLAG
ncbi:hypothetical protein B0J13DRAFT_2905 [Dactylonectria estremocensis]|uniref:Uncharacterized protein n=1 Tax=Dactylonectria estremocensis TaxID=1079267 RepID=A0A9P9FIA7_9HYPO|nr:hypothetical protein B0J13DRAFT_2905 [Dactylonectria estremocensis]